MSSDTVKDLTPSRENNVATENKDAHIGNNGGTEILSKNQRKKLLRHQKWEEERNLRKSVTLYPVDILSHIPTVKRTNSCNN